MSGDCQRFVIRLPSQIAITNQIFFRLLSPALGDYANAVKWGERALEAAGAWARSAKNVRKSVILCILCAFFSNGMFNSGIFDIMLYQYQIMTHWVPQKNSGISFFVPWQRWKRGTLCLGLPRQFVLRSCLTLQDPSCRQGPNLSASFCLSTCRPCFKVLPWMLKEPADQWYLSSLFDFTWNTFWTWYKLQGDCAIQCH